MTRLTRRAALAGGGTALLAALAGCTAPTQSTAVLSEGFETSLDPWRRNAAIGPEVPVEEFDWAIERSREQAAAGEWSLRIDTEGDHDDGTAWVVREFDPPADADGFRVTARAWSESESFNLLRHLVMALASSPPESEADFPDPGVNSTGIADAPYGGLREPLHQSEGWREYAFEWTPDTVPDTLSLAVGVSVVWEAAATHYIDEIRVEAL